ncbi:MAG: hypothetical protein KatS3mg064_2826 [Tepidiforma sp.]|nr:hypothetical protein [Tepidiforma sp.]GIW19669.1 MAG: hypothetical protein KatS3mg064_2826 [Tepidiforma sp.]
MTTLQYIGPPPGGGLLPLPEGWQPFDHDEPDSRTAALKVQSGFYRPAEAADRDGAPEPPRPASRRSGKQTDPMEEA